MGWSIGGPDERGRWVGYGVRAYCDHPKCNEEIDRGLAYVCCDEEPFGGPRGCGLYFCPKHQHAGGRCIRCLRSQPPYKKLKPEHPEWIEHMLTDESWARWRAEHPKKVEELRAAIPSKMLSTLSGSHTSEVKP
jgi:hypothetical protein